MINTDEFLLDIIDELISKSDYAIDSYKFRGEALKILREYFKQKDLLIFERDSISNWWSTDDVLHQADELGISINPEEAKVILSNCTDDIEVFNPYIWESIEDSIKKYVGIETEED